MFKKIKYIFAILLICLFFTNCKYGFNNCFYYGSNVNERTKNGILHLDDNPVKTKIEYNILIIADTHFGSRWADVPYKKLYNYLDSIKNTEDWPSFVICLGDSTNAGEESEFILYTEFLQHLQNEYGLKTYNTIGNHDCYQFGWENWKEYCYPYTPFYKFQTQNFSYYFLDTATGTIGKNQLEHLKKDMQNDKNPKIVSSHYPIYTSTMLFCLGDSFERNELISLFQQNNVKFVIGGHIHDRPESINLGTFSQEVISSFTYENTFALLKVNEANQSTQFTLKTLN